MRGKPRHTSLTEMIAKKQAELAELQSLEKAEAELQGTLRRVSGLAEAALRGNDRIRLTYEHFRRQCGGDEDEAERQCQEYGINVALTTPEIKELMIEGFTIERRTLSVIHDETSEFESAFQCAFDVFAKAQKASVQLQNVVEVYSGLDTLKNFLSGSSKQ